MRYDAHINRHKESEGGVLSKNLFSSPAANRNAKLALIASILAFVVILLGAYTRLTNAGLSCPDWPNCFGYLTAPHTVEQIQDASSRYPGTTVDVKGAWTEMTHRYFAGTEGILILILSFSLLRHARASRLNAPRIVFILLALLGVQVTLGMLTVTQNLKPVIVLGHLVTGVSILSVLWWTFLRLSKRTPVAANNRIKGWLTVGLIITAIQVTLGGWVSTHYAGLACIDLPYCNGQLLPTMQWHLLNSDLITIHMLHRIGALITASYMIIMTITLWRFKQWRGTLMHILAIVALQVTLGVLNILWLRPVWLALMHHAVGILLLLSLIAAIAKTRD